MFIDMPKVNLVPNEGGGTENELIPSIVETSRTLGSGYVPNPTTYNISYSYTDKPDYVLLQVATYNNNAGFSCLIDMSNDEWQRLPWGYDYSSFYNSCNVVSSYSNNIHSIALTIATGMDYISVVRFGGSGGTRVS